MAAATSAAAWGAIALLVAGSTIGACGLSLILVPSFAASRLIGRSRRMRAARAAGPATALVVGMVLLGLVAALVALTVGIDHHPQGEPKDGGVAGWAALRAWPS